MSDNKTERTDESDNELEEPTSNEKFLAASGIVSIPNLTFDYKDLRYVILAPDTTGSQLQIKLDVMDKILSIIYQEQEEAEANLKSLTRQVALCRFLAKKAL